jgi:hypothetical protein
VRLLAYVTGSVNQELLLRNEYLAAENRILRTKLPARQCLSDPERITLAEIGKRLGRKALWDVACVAKPDTILAWYRRLVAQKFDGSKHRQYPGRPPVSNHQGKGNRPDVPQKGHLSNRNIICRQRLGGLLKYYQRGARIFLPNAVVCEGAFCVQANTPNPANVFLNFLRLVIDPSSLSRVDRKPMIAPTHLGG